MILHAPLLKRRIEIASIVCFTMTDCDHNLRMRTRFRISPEHWYRGTRGSIATLKGTFLGQCFVQNSIGRKRTLFRQIGGFVKKPGRSFWSVTQAKCFSAGLFGSESCPSSRCTNSRLGVTANAHYRLKPWREAQG